MGLGAYLPAKRAGIFWARGSECFVHPQLRATIQDSVTRRWHYSICKLALTLPIKTLPRALMTTALYKRNQIEEAITKVLTRDVRTLRTIRTQIKRLLETDRLLPLEEPRGGAGPARHTHSIGRRPGRGVEVWFTDVEAFALLGALEFMVHQCAQSFAVAVMRQVRLELDQAYSRVLGMDPDWLFDAKAPDEWAEKGQLPFDKGSPALLTIVSHRSLAKSSQALPYACGIAFNMAEASKFAKETRSVAGVARTILDITPSSYRIARTLKETQPKARGRG